MTGCCVFVLFPSIIDYALIKFHSTNFLVQPSTRAVKFGAVKPVINGAFIAPSATVVGNVKIGSNSSVWYGAVIRGTNYFQYELFGSII